MKIIAGDLLCFKLLSPTTTTTKTEESGINCSKHTRRLHQPEARLCKGLQHCLACSIILCLREILGNASAEVQGQAQASHFGERYSQPWNTRTVAGANDVISTPLTMVNVKIR